MVFVSTLTTPRSPGVPTTNPLAPVMLSVVPELIRVVWVLFVLPNCKEAMVPGKLPSTVLLMFEAELTLPVSKNFTSSPEAGAVPDVPAVALVQLLPVDQLVSAPVGPLQMIVAASTRHARATCNKTARLSSKTCGRRKSKNCRRKTEEGVFIGVLRRWYLKMTGRFVSRHFLQNILKFLHRRGLSSALLDELANAICGFVRVEQGFQIQMHAVTPIVFWIRWNIDALRCGV